MCPSLINSRGFSSLLIGFAWACLPLARSAEVVDPLRLTREIEPLAQSVSLAVDPAQESYTGSVRIDVVAHRELNSFRLHALGPVLQSPKLIDSGGRELALTATITDAELGIVTLQAPTPIPAGTYVLTTTFSNQFHHDGLGLYKTVSRGDPYLFTQFEDRHARQAFPCWDEPEFKIPWQLNITIPTALEVVSNAPAALETRAGSTKTIAFARTPPMQSYIVAVSVGPFEFTPVPGLSVPGRIVTPRGQAAFAAEAARVSPALLAHLEAYFGIPYSYAKLDQIAVPEYVYGAMENAGLITFVDTVLLMDPDKPPFSARRRMANVVAHEMAHMWFGDLVTMKWWDDLWLNESFADWMCAKIIGETHPEFRIEIEMLDEIQNAMRTDALPSVLPIRRHLTARDDPGQVVDELTYNKGKAIMRMVENWIGPEKFRAAMHAYFIKHRWGNTSSDDLWAAFNEVSGENISALLAAFIEKPGIPLVSVKLQSEDQLVVSQSRFSNLGRPPVRSRWQVPVIVAWSKAGRVQRERILLTEESQTINVPGISGADWIYPNAGETGYYRWVLSPDLNARLARHPEALAPIERFGLLDDASALLNSGRLAGTDYLAYLSAFAHDEEPEVIAKISKGLDAVRDTFVQTKNLTAFNALRGSLLKPALTRIGLKPLDLEPAHLAPLRAALFLALGREVADADVIAASRELTAQYLGNPSSVDASLARSALLVAAYHGNVDLLTALEDAVDKSVAPPVRANAIAGLGGFSDPRLSAQALAYSLSPKLNSTEFLGVAYNLSRQPARREQVVDWVIANFPAIKAKAPLQRMAGIVEYVQEADPQVFEKLRAFLIDPSRKNQTTDVNAVKAADRAELGVKLREKEQASIDSFLSTFPAMPKDAKR